MNRSESAAALYIRLSRDENGEKADSIETQQKLLETFAAKNFPGKSVRIYTDDNVSGVTFDRPALKQFTEDVKRGLADTLILKDLSRLGRSNAKTLLFLEETELLGVRIITADGRYDSEKNFELAGIDSWFNERYVMDISRKIRSNIKQKIESGQYVGSAPYGYRKKEDVRNRLEPDPETAPIVREIFNLYISGFGYKRIADILDSRGILPPSPSRSKSLCWNPVTIKRILSNRVYLGTTVQGISRKVSFKSKKTCRLPPDMWTVTDGTHEPLVTAAVWEKAAACGSCRRASASAAYKPLPTPEGTPSINFFSRIIRCGICGGPMIKRLSKGRPAAYICARYAKHGAESCCRNGIRIDFLLKAVAADIAETAERQSELLKKPRTTAEDSPLQEKIKQVTPRKISEFNEKTLRQKQENVYNDYLDGKISEDLFLRMNKIIEDKLAGQENADFSFELENPENEFEPSKLLAQLKDIAENVAIYGMDGFKAFFKDRHFCDRLDVFNQLLFAETVKIAVCNVTVLPGEVTILYRNVIH